MAGGAIALVLGLVATFAPPRILSWLGPAAPAALLSASGRIEGRITTLTPKTGAWVVALHVDERQAVRQGQVLATRDDRAQRERVRGPPQVEAGVRVEYNPNLVETWFSGLLEVFNQITMIAMLLAAAMVRDREHGTIEHLLVSPLRPLELFTAKVVPVVVLVPLAALGSMFGIVHGVFATPIRGSVALFYAVTVIYVFALASLGLAIAVLARNLGQAMLLLLLILYPMMLLSGAFTPPESMGPLMRYASLVSPALRGLRLPGPLQG